MCCIHLHLAISPLTQTVYANANYCTWVIKIPTVRIKRCTTVFGNKKYELVDASVYTMKLSKVTCK